MVVGIVLTCRAKQTAHWKKWNLSHLVNFVLSLSRLLGQHQGLWAPRTLGMSFNPGRTIRTIIIVGVRQWTQLPVYPDTLWVNRRHMAVDILNASFSVALGWSPVSHWWSHLPMNNTDNPIKYLIHELLHHNCKSQWHLNACLFSPWWYLLLKGLNRPF